MNFQRVASALLIGPNKITLAKGMGPTHWPVLCELINSKILDYRGGDYKVLKRCAYKALIRCAYKVLRSSIRRWKWCAYKVLFSIFAREEKKRRKKSGSLTQNCNGLMPPG